MSVRQETNKDGFVCYFKKQANGTETLLPKYQIDMTGCPKSPAIICCPGCMGGMHADVDKVVEGDEIKTIPKTFGAGNNSLRYSCPSFCLYEYTKKTETEPTVDRFTMFVNFVGKNNFTPGNNVVRDWFKGKTAIADFAKKQAIEFGLDEGVTPEEEKKIAKMPMKRKTTEKIEEDDTIDVSQDALRKKFLHRHDSDEIYTQVEDDDDNDFIEDVLTPPVAVVVPKTPVSTMVPKKMFKPSTTTSNYSKKK